MVDSPAYVLLSERLQELLGLRFDPWSDSDSAFVFWELLAAYFLRQHFFVAFNHMPILHLTVVVIQ